MSALDNASQFFDACETGKGWETCKQWCHPEASFTAQADALNDITTLADYCEWMKGLLVPVPDGSYDIKGMALDEERQVVVVYAVFHGTHTVEGPVPATGKTVASDYVYSIVLQDDKVRHLTKIWNDGHALKQLGWA